VMIGDDRVVEA